MNFFLNHKLYVHVYIFLASVMEWGVYLFVQAIGNNNFINNQQIYIMMQCLISIFKAKN